ncbi:uncharacterized protein LOC131172122 [Hevea brasiliensis]|uniref:uncharacterized protein LOC131172122 n=1 Tax=Hevea brasiliensis TaxID=3981 RepID=UPI0025E9BCD5|nr:uncharacterized protein LOC131172122 [Hevea brasiliensis]
MKPPSYHEVRVRLLNKEAQTTNELLQSHKEEWTNYGCSLLCDGWLDRKGRTLINFVVNSSKGSVFIKSIDASDESKIAALLTNLIEKELMEIGPEKVVQVVTDNALNNVTVVDNEKKLVVGYIYEARDRAKETIANSFNGNEEKYKHIFEIIDARWSVQLHHPLHAAGYFLNPEFFYPNKMRIEHDEEVNSGLLSCIHKMEQDSTKVDMIIDEIENYLVETYGSSTPNLQKFAIKVLNITCSASGCERNRSVFEHLHSKKRNQLFQECLDKLVYVKYNRALLRQYTFGDIATPIDLANIDENNEWLLGELKKGDGDDDDDTLVFMDDVLTWGDVGRAAGVSESHYESRSVAKSTPVKTPSFGGSHSMRGASSSQVDNDEEEEEFVMEVVENEDNFENLDDE